MHGMWQSLTPTHTQLSWSCGIYIAVAPLLLEVLHHPTFHKRLSKSTAKPLSLQLALRVPKKHLQTFPALVHHATPSPPSLPAPLG